MATDVSQELEAFRRFLGEQLSSGQTSLTPEGCLALWRVHHPTSRALRADVQAVQEALDDMDAGETGQPFDQFLAEFRARSGLPA